MTEQHSHAHASERTSAVCMRRALCCANACFFCCIFVPNGQESQLKEHTLADIAVGVAAMRYVARLALPVIVIFTRHKKTQPSADEIPILSAYFFPTFALFHIHPLESHWN